MQRLGFCVALATAWILVCSVPQAQAQGGFVKPSAEQVAKNAEAIKAVQRGDFNKAIALFEASLELGELNITYLNLGRTYQRAGRCVDAQRTFDKVTRAPKVAVPNPSAVATKVSTYRGELNKQCPGRLTLQCKPAEGVTIVIDESKPLPCNEARSLPLTPGEHEVVATFAEQRQKRTIRVPVDKPITEEIAIEGLPTPDPNDLRGTKDPIADPSPVDQADTTLGYALLIGGGAAVVTGLVLDLILAPGVQGQFNDGDDSTNPYAQVSVPIALYVLGGGAALWGLLELL